MASGSPNSGKLNNFVAKVYDPTQKKYRPIYELPDATDKIYGGVLLSDAVNSTAAAAKGVTAATPKAVKTAYDTANNKLDKTTTTAQTVAGATTFSSLVTGSKGFSGDLAGNATTATKLQTARTLTVSVTGTGDENQISGSTTFDGSKDVTISIPRVPAPAIIGTISLANLPQGAMDKLVTVASAAKRLALTTDTVQTGDSVYQSDTGAMYMVVDDTKLNSESGYQIYKAGTALEANHATSADTATSATSATKATQDSAGQQINTTYIKGLSVSGKTITYTKGNGTTGTITTQDTTYSDMKGAASSAAGTHGLVPAPAAGRQESFLRGDGAWVVPTNTTYSDFKGATSSAAGTHGLVPAPATSNTGYYLRGDGTWATAPLTGVKGNAESSYRTGNVNITPANIGALALTGGTVTGATTISGAATLSGGLTLSGSILPATTNAVNLGSSSVVFSNIYATTFNGTATNISDGIVTTAKIKDANVTTAKIASSAVTTNKINSSAVTTDKINSSAVTTDKIATNAVTTDKINSSAVTPDKISNSNVTLAKLGSDVGTISVGTTEPTDSRIKIWIKTAASS